MAGKPSSRRRWLQLAVIGGVLSVPLGWFGTDALERDNDFCNACHFSDGTPLHEQLRQDFDARPPSNLGALHAGVPVAQTSAERAFRCIDCHGGVGLAGKARVKVLAAKDAFWWLTGRFEEPSEMHWPLLDADCRRCHDEFAVKAEEWATPAFHDLAVHNAELGVACVECHAVHEAHGNADAYFLRASQVRVQCARCHPEFEEGIE